MKKFSAFILLPCAFALLTAGRVEAAPVTWDFIATGCSDQSTASFGVNGCDPRQTYPVVLATLTLTGPDSSGSAIWAGDAVPAPVYTAGGFSLDFSSGYAPLTPAFAGNPPFGYCQAPTNICAFDLSWSESAGQLAALSLNVDGYNDDFGGSPKFTPGPAFGLTGGIIASDDVYHGAGNAFVGCVTSACQISGYWLNDALLTAPEPGSLALLASAFGVWGLTGRRTVRPKGLHANTT